MTKSWKTEEKNWKNFEKKLKEIEKFGKRLMKSWKWFFFNKFEMSFVLFKLQYYHKSTPKSDYAHLKWTQKKSEIYKISEKYPKKTFFGTAPNLDGFYEKCPKPRLALK